MPRPWRMRAVQPRGAGSGRRRVGGPGPRRARRSGKACERPGRSGERPRPLSGGSLGRRRGDGRAHAAHCRFGPGDGRADALLVGLESGAQQRLVNDIGALRAASGERAAPGGSVRRAQNGRRDSTAGSPKTVGVAATAAGAAVPRRTWAPSPRVWRPRQQRQRGTATRPATCAGPSCSWTSGRGTIPPPGTPRRGRAVPRQGPRRAGPAGALSTEHHEGRRDPIGRASPADNAGGSMRTDAAVRRGALRGVRRTRARAERSLCWLPCVRARGPARSTLPP